MRFLAPLLAGALLVLACSSSPEYLEECSTERPCEGEALVCSPSTRVCVRIGDLGAPCKVRSDCSSFEARRCAVEGVCATPKPLGDACTSSDECDDRASHRCLSGTCTRVTGGG
jgi:hypothetical protein